jgi:hypothetical protein
MTRIGFCHEIRSHLLYIGRIGISTQHSLLGHHDNSEKRQNAMATYGECSRGTQRERRTLKEVEFCEAAASRTAAPSQEWSQLTPNNKRSRMATM